MKKILCTLSLMLVVFTTHAAVEINGIYYNLNSSTQTAEVTSNPNKYSGSVYLYNQVYYGGKYYKITSISSSAFRNCTGLTYISIGSACTTIGERAFSNCTNLEVVLFENNAMSIGYNAFENVGSITTPCFIYAPKDYNFGVDTSGNYFQWKGGYFRFAQSAVSITMSDVYVPQGGRGEMVVTLNNNHPDLTGWQIEFVLPDGIHLVGGEIGKVVMEHNPYMQFFYIDRHGGGIMGFQVDITPMPTGEYELMRLTFEAEDDVPLGSYAITTSHLEFADMLTGTGLHLTPQTFNINVVDGIIPTPLVGDVNNDGLLSLSDAVCIISWLLEQEPPVFKEELADFNEDGNITNSDAVAIILYLLDGGAANAPMARAMSEVGNKVVGYETSREGFDLQMGVLHDYTAMMMDVTLPEGETLQEVTLDGGHSLAFRALGEGRYRIAAWSMGMEPLRDGAVLHCTTSSGHAGRVVVDNLRLVDMDTHEFGAKAVSCEPTGISEVTAGEAGEFYHTLGGVRVARPGHGVYVTKGRKVVK